MDSNLTGLLIGISSFVFAIIIFFYQEKREKHKKTKEVQLLTEDIITQIVRNSTQHKISFLEIDISLLLDGFALLRNVDLKCSLRDLLKMIYMKIFENDYISKADKVKILREINDQLAMMNSGYDYDFYNNIENTDINNRFSKLFSLLIVMTIFLLLGLSITQLYNDNFQITTNLLYNQYFIVAFISLALLVIASRIYIHQMWKMDNRKKLFDNRYSEIYRSTFNPINPPFSKYFESDFIINDNVKTETIAKTSLAADESKKIILGEIVLLRNSIDNEIQGLMEKYLQQKSSERMPTIMALKRLAASIENKKDVSNETTEKSYECYKVLRGQLENFNRMLHYPNDSLNYSELFVENMKSELSENLEILKCLLEEVENIKKCEVQE